MNTYSRTNDVRRALPGTALTPYRWRDGRSDHTSIWAGARRQDSNGRSQARRALAMRERKLSRCLMYTTIGVIVMMLFMQIGMISTLTKQQQRINAANRENQILAADLENLETELSLQVRNDVIQQKAALQLGMVFPGEHDIRVINGVALASAPGGQMASGSSSANP